MQKTTSLKRGVLVGALLATALVGVATIRSWSSKPPNILLITLDTTRADRIGCYGYEPAETPHLDALAQTGVLFERAYAPAPLTLPSHTSMLTGLWPPEHGVITNGQMALEPGIPTVAELLKEQGYDTAAFLSVFVLHSKFGLDRGFQLYDDDLPSAVRTADVLHRSRDGRHAIDAAMNWLRERDQQRDDSPFFCWIHLFDPHEPYVLHPREFGTNFDERRYDSEIAYTDRLVGRILDALCVRLESWWDFEHNVGAGESSREFDEWSQGGKTWTRSV